MRGLGAILGAVEFWVAVVAAAASIAGAVISRTGDGRSSSVRAPQAPAEATSAPFSCLDLLERTRAWANDHPRDAAAYAAVGDAGVQGLPSLWSHAERDACGADPERLLERGGARSDR